MNNNLNLEDKVRSEHDRDLPLSSNFQDIKVEHFVLDLLCSFTEKVFDSSITLFCKISGSLVNSGENMIHSDGDFKQKQEKLNDFAAKNSKLFLCLDCFKLDVSSCNSYIVTPDCHPTIETLAEQPTSDKQPLKIPQKYMDCYYQTYKSLQINTQQQDSLNFIVYKHSLKVYLPPNLDTRLPVILKICYRTHADGPLLMWTADQCGRPCVFTIGHQLNNRSLFPSQDLPQAMSTWHSSVTLMDPDMEKMSVVMTGETDPEIFINTSGQKVFNFCSSYPMPAATFALAVGTWSVTELINPPCFDNLDSERYALPHCHLFSPDCLHEQGVCQLGMYLPVCFEVLNSLFGPYPMKHLDILFVPECFDSLGLACPHLMFLSQSLLSDDKSMLYRLSHELCHTWFGILTGPKDWTEEWLTEGVCCYLEDIVHAGVMKWNNDENRERLELRALLKFRILASEISHTPEDLQTLRPNGTRMTKEGEMNDIQHFVRNGLNHDKTVMQVHYLKGYFLMRYLEDIAGTEVFLKALTSFTSEYLGQLFTSKELLDYFFENCCNLRTSGLTVAKICQDWLDSPGMPYPLDSFPSTVKCHLVTDVEQQVSVIKEAASRKRARGSSSSLQKGGSNTIQAEKLLPEQLVLLLEMLVEEEVAVTAGQLKVLRDTHNIQEANAEVKHSWCELVIHRKAVKWIKDVESFLLHHRALGVYLYGELLISGNRKLQALAYDCYNKIQVDMPEGAKTIVIDMLFPS